MKVRQLGNPIFHTSLVFSWHFFLMYRFFFFYSYIFSHHSLIVCSALFWHTLVYLSTRKQLVFSPNSQSRNQATPNHKHFIALLLCFFKGRSFVSLLPLPFLSVGVLVLLSQSLLNWISINLILAVCVLYLRETHNPTVALRCC